MKGLRISQIHDFDFLNNNQINDSNDFPFNNNIKSSYLLINEINDSINKNLTQSVLDLVNCFICLSPANEPLTCPKCNNFACKKCLETYFGNDKEKKCPICKSSIQLSELKENKIIEEIENILNKNNNKENKVNELSAIIEEKKRIWENQNNNIGFLIEKIFKFQEDLKNYKNEYSLFLLNSQKLIEKTFEEFNTKMEILINSLLSYNKIVDDSIQKYNTIYDNNLKNTYNNNIKKLINEILALERKRFNDKTHIETEQFLNTPIKLVPSINIYNIKHITFKKIDFNKDKTISFNGNHFKLGTFKLKYEFKSQNGYKAICNFDFTLSNDSKKMCFLISQLIIYKDKQKLIPMKLINNNFKTYSYKCEISGEEFYNLDEDEVKMKTEALIFTI